MLLKAGSDVSILTNFKSSALLLAVSQMQNPEVVKLLLEAGADVSSKIKNGSTALHLATSRMRNLEVIKLLLEAGADVSASDNKGRTPLHCATMPRCGDKITMEFLETLWIRWPLAPKELASLWGSSSYQSASLEVILELIVAGADLTARDVDGRTPLDLCCGFKRKKSVNTRRQPLEYSTHYRHIISDKYISARLGTSDRDLLFDSISRTRNSYSRDNNEPSEPGPSSALSFGS